MNDDHARLCASPEWAEYLRTEVLAPLLRDVDLGHRMIEVGPGPGGTTDWLRHGVTELVAAEADVAAATALGQRFADSNVTVVSVDGSALPYPDASFDSAACFTMLHHVATRELQHAVIAEMTRVLRPSGVLVGSDSLASEDLRAFHAGDVYNPLPPPELLGWLQSLGCRPIALTVSTVLTFVATKPSPTDEAACP